MTQESLAPKVLLIEDSQLVRDALVRGLCAYAVQTAGRGQDALRLLQNPTASFDVVVCDINLPDISGEKLYARISAQRPNYQDRFLFMTGGTLNRAQIKFLQNTRQPVFYKPFQLKMLRDAIRSMSWIHPPPPTPGV